MSIPTGGLAALLVVSSIAIISCGSDDTTVTTTTIVTPSTAGRTTTPTQLVESVSAPARTTTTQSAESASGPATTTRPTQTAESASPPAITTPQPTRTVCPLVDVGVRDGDIEETFARIGKIRNVKCVSVDEIVRQWGGQQIGRSDALLPDGWKCTKNNVCSNGTSSVSFVLEFP